MANPAPAPYISIDNASDMAKRRWQLCPTHSKPEPALIVHDALNGVIREPHIARELQRMLKIIDEQIDNTVDELNAEPTVYCEHCKQGGAMSGSHRAALLRALDGLIERKTALLGIPNPGSLKPSTPRQAQRSATVEPIGPAPQSSAVQGMPSASQGHAGPGQDG